jgi:glycerol-3-phosphate acyltransferase PlsY
MRGIPEIRCGMFRESNAACAESENLMVSIPFFVFLLLAFLTGCVPFAYILVKRLRGMDIRTQGSGNVGATNASRVLGRKWGLVVLALDTLKGVAAAWFLPWVLFLLPNPSVYERWLGLEGTQLILGMAAFLGHCYNPFLKFKGGKGVATALGVFLIVSWKATVLTAVVCLAIIAATRLVSVASIVAAILLPAAMLTFQLIAKGSEAPWYQRVNWKVLAMTVLISVVVMIRHRANIKRLLAGKEHKA